MCFLACISNSNVSNELEKSSDWEQLGISKLKNNPNLKEANEGVPQKCTFECFILQNVQTALPVESSDCNVSFEYGCCFCAALCWHQIMPVSFSVSSPLWSLSLLIFFPGITCSHEGIRQPVPDSDKKVLLSALCSFLFYPNIPRHALLNIFKDL